ncbi:MAG TPA: amino acid ABC transporter permease [Chloroflexota bacterium]|jgi:putative glutamine transport system permease protein
MEAVLDNLSLLLEGLWTTVRLALLAGSIALTLGLIVALFRVSPIGPLAWVGMTFVEFVRNVPLLAHLFFWVYGLPFVGILLPEFIAAFCGLGVYTAAYVAEAMRAGIQAVSRGQIEAARSLGLSYVRMMRLVVLPQAVATVVPPLGNLAISMTKNTSVAAAVTVPELLFQTQVINARTFATYPVFIVSAALYLLLTLPMGVGVSYLERKLTRFRAAPQT